jgi:hypothetical protein
LLVYESRNLGPIQELPKDYKYMEISDLVSHDAKFYYTTKPAFSRAANKWHLRCRDEFSPAPAKPEIAACRQPEAASQNRIPS